MYNRICIYTLNAKLFRCHNWAETEAQTDAFISVKTESPPPFVHTILFQLAIFIGNASTQIHTKLTYEIAF